jgi:hypothetical protein
MLLNTEIEVADRAGFEPATCGVRGRRSGH